jgi:uncharacterized protein involved in exopolysaccharide biosynthesis
MRFPCVAAAFAFLICFSPPIGAAEAPDAQSQLCGAPSGEACETCCSPEVTQADVDAARADLSERIARYELALRLLNDGGDTEIELLVSPAIEEALRQHEGLRRRLAELEAYLDPDHPVMRALMAEIDELERVVRTELRRLLAVLQSEIEMARQRVARLEALVATE